MSGELGTSSRQPTLTDEQRAIVDNSISESCGIAATITVLSYEEVVAYVLVNLEEAGIGLK